MTIVVVCVADSAAELVAKARSLSAKACVTALCEDDSCPCAGEDRIVRIGRVADDCAQGTRIAQALKVIQPDIGLFPATIRGRFLSAWVAAKLETGLTADCTELALTPEGRLLQTRPAFGGSLTADIVCAVHRPQLASVRPGVFGQPLPGERPEAVRMDLPETVGLLTPLRFLPSESGIALQSARVIVTGGKGVGGKRGFEKLQELARLLGGMVGATRGAVDAGWISYSHQIGQTGVTVRPEWYLCFGVSGMIQHVAGMSAAKKVIAVNSDRSAPIFRCADYGFVGDWEAVADQMIKHLKERKEKP